MSGDYTSAQIVLPVAKGCQEKKVRWRQPGLGAVLSHALIRFRSVTLLTRLCDDGRGEPGSLRVSLP